METIVYQEKGVDSEYYWVLLGRRTTGTTPTGRYGADTYTYSTRST